MIFKKLYNNSALKITLLYFIFGFLWILFSDILLEKIAQNFVQINQFQTYKGWFFIFSTSLLIFYLINKELVKKSKINDLLKKEEDKFRLLIENHSSVIWSTNLEGKTNYISSNIENVYGYTANEIYENSEELWIKRIHPDDVEIVTSSFSNLFNENAEFNVEYRIKHKNGKWIWLSDKAKIVKNINGDNYATGVFVEITEKKKAEHLLIESETRYRMMFENAKDGIFLMKDDIFIDTNGKSLQMFGYKKDEFIGKSPVELSPEFQPDGELSSVKALKYINDAYEGKNVRFEWKHKRLNGDLFDAEVSLNLIEIKGEKLLQVINRDISKRKENELKIKENQLFIQRITEQSPDIIYIYDIASDKNIYINKSLAKILGYNKDEISSDSNELFKVTIHPDDMSQFKNMEGKIADWDSEFIIDYEYRLKSKNGDWRWFAGKEKEFQRVNGKIVTLIGTVSDITERKIAEKYLLESEERFRELSALTIEGIAIHEKGIGIDANLSFENITGYTLEELVGQNLIDLIIAPQFHEEVKKTISDGGTKPYETLAIRKNGDTFPMEIESREILWSNKNMRVACVRDISERKKSELAFQESEDRYRTIVENISDGLIVITDDEFLSVNSAYCKMHGYTLQEIINLKVSSLIHEDNEQKVDIYKALLEQKGHLEEDVIGKCKDGSKIYIHVNARKFKFNQKDAVLCIVGNITHRKLTEQRIVKSIINTEEKERARFAKELHDGLGPIFSTVKLYFQWLSETNDAEKRGIIIDKGNKNIQEAITTLREISNNLNPHVLVNYGLIEAVKIFINNLSINNKVEFEYITTLKERFSKEIEITLYRTVTELINNTLKYADATKVIIKLIKSNKKNSLTLIYLDNGKGFDAKKVKTQKSGLGLFNIKNRVNSINGNIKIKTKRNNGFFSEIKVNLDT